MKVPLRILQGFLEEDTPFGDLTSETLAQGIQCVAGIITHEEGIIAGVEEATDLFSSLDLAVRPQVQDGTWSPPETRVLEIAGEAAKILLAERTVLNVMGRMSGIATMTRRLVDTVHAINPQCRIASTRKTAPGLRFLDKKAVMLGGGESHRFTLSDMILIKDNHLAFVPLEEAITRAKAQGPYRVIEVEVTTPLMAEEAVRLGAHVIMLDNMRPVEVAETLTLLENEGIRKMVIVEISGGITEENIQDYAVQAVDVISMGNLTHSVRSLNMSLEILDRE
ncbi:MAG: carboxylating nicotinate-nucleotide diphosphorylase [Methanomicrobiales archaeon]|nr:carboxylating nicotinate-nucleotide diphosphorylase [Methanomicrobiales archaeon]